MTELKMEDAKLLYPILLEYVLMGKPDVEFIKACNILTYDKFLRAFCRQACKEFITKHAISLVPPQDVNCDSEWNLFFDSYDKSL
jgi:hypothetical protein